jgi:hypothetical protein
VSFLGFVSSFDVFDDVVMRSFVLSYGPLEADLGKRRFERSLNTSLDKR